MTEVQEYPTSPAVAISPQEELSNEKREPTEPEPQTHNHDDSKADRDIRGLRWILIVLAVLSSTFLYALDNTVTANVRPAIIQTFGNQVEMLTWLSISYPMGEVGTNPLWGKLYKHFDNKLLYPSTVFIFEVGSAVIGSAQSIDAVIVGRAIAGAVYYWDDSQMVGLYVATAVIWFTFWAQQHWNILTVDRLFPIHFFADWEMASFFCWGSLAIANVVVTIYSLPLFYQFVYGDSGLRSAAYTIPFVAAAVVVGGASGPLFNKYPVYMPWFAGSAALMLVGNCLLTTIDYHTSRGVICGYTVIQGAACGPIMQLGYTVVQVKLRQTDSKSLADATGFMSCSQMAGLALSLGIATAVFLNGATSDISDILPGVPRQSVQATIDGVQTSVLQMLTPDQQLRVLEVIAKGVAMVFYMNVAGSALGLILALFMKRERLNLNAVA